jgi:SprT protein
MSLSAEQKQLVIRTVAHFTEMGNKKFGINMAVPTTLFNKRGTTAGEASYSTHTVNFNADMCAQNFDEFINQVVPHEVAHLVTHEKYSKGTKRFNNVKAHGHEWRHVMVTFGLSPDRCHKMDVSEFKQQRTKYEYVCPSCGRSYKVGGKIHNNIQGGKVYVCKCKGRLSPNSVVGVQAPTAKKKVETTTVTTSREGSKKDRAERLYADFSTKSREFIITLFMSELDMTKAGASTYYANCKKKF